MCSLSFAPPSAPAYRPSSAPKRRVLLNFAVHKSSPAFPKVAVASPLSWLLGTAAPPAQAAWIDVPLLLPLSTVETEELERMLQARLALPAGLTVFGVVRTDEARTAPPLPLVLLHGLVDADEERCDVSVLVRPLIQARPGITLAAPPPPAISLDLLARGDTAAGAELVARLRRGSAARLVAGEALAACLADCYAALPAFFGQPTVIKARCHTKLRPRLATCEQYAG